MYQIKINDKFEFDIVPDSNQFLVNGKVVDFEKVDLNKNSSHFIYQNKSYTIEVEEIDPVEKIAVIKVNGNSYSLTIKNQLDQLLKQLGMDNLTANKILQVKAPMPGLVLNVLVIEGAEVKKGDNLLVLEAMKMENMIKSPTDGVIKKIAVKQGDKIEKNELLISFQ